MTVADTDVLIEVLRHTDRAERVRRELRAGTLATTAVTVFELRGGARVAGARMPVEQLLSALPVLPFDDQAATRAAETRRALESYGEPIGIAEYLIVGICLASSATLLTRNRKRFERVPGLILGSL